MNKIKQRIIIKMHHLNSLTRSHSLILESFQLKHLKLKYKIGQTK